MSLLNLIRWGKDKFPAESPLLFYRQGQPVLPPLSSQEGLAAVLSSTLDFIERTVPPRALKVWRLQSPRHFQGGDWNQNGSCSGLTLLNDTQVQASTSLPSPDICTNCRQIKLYSILLDQCTRLIRYRTGHIIYSCHQH